VAGKTSLSDSFPTQPPALVREMVTVSHFDLKRVSNSWRRSRPWPALRGTGIWRLETALGASSHMGNRPIAEFLIANGAGHRFLLRDARTD